MCPDISSAITLLILELEETKPFFIKKNPTFFCCFFFPPQKSSRIPSQLLPEHNPFFSHQVSSGGEGNSRKQTLFLTCSWRLWASACWSSCSSLSLSISYCCSQSTSPWEPSGVLFSLFSSKSLVISVKLVGPEESESTVMLSWVFCLLPANPSLNQHNPCSTVTSADRESSTATKNPWGSNGKSSEAQLYS